MSNQELFWKLAEYPFKIEDRNFNQRQIINLVFDDPKVKTLFILSYYDLFRPQEIFEILQERYEMNGFYSVDIEWKEHLKFNIEYSTLLFLEEWLNLEWDFSNKKRYPDDFNFKFTDFLKKESRNHSICEKILKNFQSKFIEVEFKKEPYYNVDIKKFSTQEIANEIYNISLDFCLQIQPSHFGYSTMTKKFSASINFFNKISSYFSNQIVLLEYLEDRTDALCQIIEIIDFLISKNEYHISRALVSCLECAFIHRLKFTHESIPKKYLEKVEKFHAIFDPSKTYWTYRDLVKEKDQFIPLFNSYFTDLTFIHDGNTNKINIMRMQGQSLIKAFYLNNYGVKTKENYDLKCSILDTFYNYVPLTDQDCFQKSLALEPRGAEISQIKKKGKEKKDCIIC